MDVQVQSLIDKIKKDGIATAESQAAEIITKARKDAERIVAEAEAKAGGLVKTARAETERIEKSSIDAIKQAGRNILLSFRDSMNRELAAIVNTETGKAYSPELLKTLVPETVKAWAAKPDAEDIAVLLPAKQLAALESGLKAALKAELARGVELRADSNLSAGFRIGTRDGAAYYDFSADSVAALFSAYLNPRVAAVMKGAAVGL
ncbi:MAG: V-type ATP synthase subunit E [Spirochaetaceae bacterium]|jgi:V/A-type H+-transporting ATPase subunit E|nr:V-type ATP synthase subunit E [Spirochaetaceae bacterium]